MAIRSKLRSWNHGRTEKNGSQFLAVWQGCSAPLQDGIPHIGLPFCGKVGRRFPKHTATTSVLERSMREGPASKPFFSRIISHYDRFSLRTRRVPGPVRFVRYRRVHRSWSLCEVHFLKLKRTISWVSGELPPAASRFAADRPPIKFPSAYGRRMKSDGQMAWPRTEPRTQ